ncbi:single strand DNA binding protein [Cellulophaga phage phi46:3]|uniref:DUF3127 domain-containing protein n=1 Tax=Cellulophaga phage phi46:3 TaxID=1327985 RepID=S0A3G6_9CAUD|nr:single strand DNA binding protein [Cellulophaga phage phi46:3]AGO48758.1 hypothetical protein Phi46:3_gp014 [Cellulophaga phage phi46:3]
MELEGKIIVIGETETFGNNGFSKRQLVIETDENFPQKLAMDFVKDKGDLLNSYTIGQSVKVGINHRGSEYNGKYYVNLQGWRIELLGQPESKPESAVDKYEAKETPAAETEQSEEEEDELPF